MKFIVILAMIMASCHALAHGGDYMDDSDMITSYARGKLVGTLEKFRTLMRTGNESLGLPVLDPFESVQEVVNINKPGLIQLDALLTKIRADGLSTYDINAGDFSVIGLKIKLDLSWSEIVLKTDYVADGMLANKIPVYGTGDVSAIIKNFNFATNLSLSVKKKHLYVRTIQSKVSLGSLNLRITGLFDDPEMSELISTAVSEMAPQVIADYQKQIVQLVDTEISTYVNDFLKDKSLKDLLGMLG